MIPYQTRSKRIAGTSYAEVNQTAKQVLKELRRQTKRKPYIRSAYFDKDKIFLDYFMPHLKQRSWKQRTSRLSYLKCAMELIKYSRQKPTVKVNPNKKTELLYRFAGLTKDKEIFYVQIKEVKRNGNKYFMSTYSPE